MTKVDECIRDKDWGALALITSEAIKIMKARELKHKTIKENRDKGKLAIQYEIDKGRKVKLRKR